LLLEVVMKRMIWLLLSALTLTTLQLAVGGSETEKSDGAALDALRP
jgi:hypothetical protein